MFKPVTVYRAIPHIHSIREAYPDPRILHDNRDGEGYSVGGAFLRYMYPGISKVPAYPIFNELSYVFEILTHWPKFLELYDASRFRYTLRLCQDNLAIAIIDSSTNGRFEESWNRLHLALRLMEDPNLHKTKMYAPFNTYLGA